MTSEVPAGGGPRQPADRFQTKLVAVLVAPLLLWMVGATLPTDLKRFSLSATLLLLLLGTTTVTDLVWHRIPNWATYSACLWGLALNATAPFVSHSFAESLGAIGIVSSLAGMASGFAVMLVVYCLAGTGAGDLKLSTAVGALVGFPAVIAVIACSHILAGIVAACYLVWVHGPVWIVRSFLAALGATFAFRTVVLPVEPADKKMPGLPMAPFFALGTLTVLLFPELAELWT